MRKAFQAAAAAWCLMLGLWLMATAPLWQWIALVLAIGATTLWLSHLVAYSLKSLNRPLRGADKQSGVDTTRREAVRRFASTFAFVAASTAMPAFSQNCNTCGSDVMNGNRGWGPCDQDCKLPNGKTMTCDPCARPVYSSDGNCYCCKFKECG